jgi:hypothetical protein
MNEFVHLRLHSEYSLVDGLVRFKALAEAVTEQGMPAVAVTDIGNFFGLVKFHKAAVAAGIKPIFGADLFVGTEEDDYYPICLLVMNTLGYRNLTTLISRAYLEGQTHDGPRVQTQWLEEHCDGLIALSAGALGEIGQALLNGRDSRRPSAWPGGRRSSRSASISNFIVPAAKAMRSMCMPQSRWPARPVALWWQRTTCDFFQRMNLRLTRRGYVSPSTERWMIRAAHAVTRSSSIFERPVRWRYCSPTFPKRSVIRWQ